MVGKRGLVATQRNNQPHVSTAHVSQTNNSPRGELKRITPNDCGMLDVHRVVTGGSVAGTFHSDRHHVNTAGDKQRASRTKEHAERQLKTIPDR
jgi:hypothetical protein